MKKATKILLFIAVLLIIFETSNKNSKAATGNGAGFVGKSYDVSGAVSYAQNHTNTSGGTLNLEKYYTDFPEFASGNILKMKNSDCVNFHHSV